MSRGRVVTDVRMYIPISKEASVLGMGPSDTRRPLERERERERPLDYEVVSVLSLSFSLSLPAPAVV